MASAESQVVLTDLHKDYKMGETTVHALRGVSLEVADGEFVAILGQSGSGKTTLLNMISALDIPSSGEVVVKGAKISSMKRDERTRFRRTSIGLVFQFYNLFPTLSSCLARGDSSLTSSESICEILPISVLTPVAVTTALPRPNNIVVSL